MKTIFAFGVLQNPLDQIEIVEMLKKVVPGDCTLKIVTDLDTFQPPFEFAWTFGSDYDEGTPAEWMKNLCENEYVFEGATLYVDQAGRVAGAWPNKAEVPIEGAPAPVQPKKEEEDNGETEIKAINELEISAKVSLVCTDEDGKIARFKVRGKYKKKRDYLIDMISIDKDNDLNKEDLQKILDWTNECAVNLLDYTIEGPAYIATQDHVHNFSLGRICLDQMHAAVLDEMIKNLQYTRAAIKAPKSATEMKIDGK